VGRIAKPSYWTLVAVIVFATRVSAQPAEDANPEDQGIETTNEVDAAAEAARVAEAKRKEDAAKDAYTQAAKEADAGRLEAALLLYKKADELVPAPAPKFKVALTLDKLERFAEAETAYQGFLEIKPDPDKFFSKIESARERIRAIAGMPGKLMVKTKPDAPPNLVLAVDRIPQAGNEIVVMPGSHNLTAVADGFTGSQTVSVRPAENKDVLITLVADRPAPVAQLPAPPAPLLATSAARPVDSHSARTAAYIAFLLAGAEVVAGTVFAFQAVHAKNVYNATPSPSNLSAVDRSTAFADAFYATGLLSAVGGTVLLLVDNSSSSSTSDR
jgi:tetratricopeptide (TPR) repeat protein